MTRAATSGKAATERGRPACQGEPPQPDDEQRQQFFALLEPHLRQLWHYARRELLCDEWLGDLLRGGRSVADVVGDVVVQAYQEWAAQQSGEIPSRRTLQRRLFRLVDAYIAHERARAWRQPRTQALEADAADTAPGQWVSTLGDDVLDFHRPDQDLQVQDMVPAVDTSTSEQTLEHAEPRARLQRALASMPRAPRRAFILCELEGLDTTDVARVMGVSEDDVGRDLDHAWEFLRQQVIEAGFAGPVPAGCAAIAVFSDRRDADVPASIRRNVEERLYART